MECKDEKGRWQLKKFSVKGDEKVGDGVQRHDTDTPPDAQATAWQN